MKSFIGRIFLCVVACMILLQAVSAVPPLPSEYYGQVTIDGAPAPAGTVITAMIGGSPRGSVTTNAGGALGGLAPFDARLVVSATEEDLFNTASPVVNFTVNGVCTDGYSASEFSSGDTRYVILASRDVAALPGLAAKPTDPDGDGMFEDLNGNGRKDFADVVRYFTQMQWISANEPVCAFDENRNGRIDFADIVALFNEI